MVYICTDLVICIYIYIYGCESKCKAPIHTLNPQADPYPRSIPKRRWSRPIHTSGSPGADPYPNFDATPYIHIYIYIHRHMDNIYIVNHPSSSLHMNIHDIYVQHPWQGSAGNQWREAKELGAAWNCTSFSQGCELDVCWTPTGWLNIGVNEKTWILYTTEKGGKKTEISAQILMFVISGQLGTNFVDIWTIPEWS